MDKIQTILKKLEKGVSLEKVVQRVNELHHDYIDKYYSKNNTLMFKLEKKNWEEIIKNYNFNNKNILEIGVGTGFLPLIFLENNIKFSKYLCTDISSRILEVAKKNILDYIKKHEKFYYENKIKFVKLNSKILPFENESFDIIVMNSVLHHIPDIDFFYKEAYRVLKKEGLLIISHEPNYYFYNSKISIVYKILSKIFRKIGALKNKIKKFLKNSGNDYYDKMKNYVNSKLLEEKLISEPLSIEEINFLVDYHASKGINFEKFPTNYFKIVEVKTYCYLGTLNYSFENSIINFIINDLIDPFLNKLDKSRLKGSNYFIVYKKIR